MNGYIVVNVTTYRPVSIHDDYGDALIECRKQIDLSRHNGKREFFEVHEAPLIFKN